MEVALPPMSARTRWPVLSILLLSLTVGHRAHAGPWSLAPGEFYSELRGGWFSADTYHAPDGGRLFLAGGGLWEQRSLTSHTEFGWKPRLNFVFGIPILSVSRTLDPDRRDLFTQTGLGDAQIGFRYKIFSGSAAAAFQVDWKAPLSYERSGFLTHADSVAAGDASGDGDSLDANVARQLGSPVLGDGQQDVTFSLLYGGPLTKSGFFQVTGGYKYRFEKPKDQIVLAADVGYWVTGSILLAGRYQGEMAGNGDRPTDEPDVQRVGPWLVYRIDDHMDLFAGSLSTFSANNSLHYDEIQVGFAFRQTKLNRLQGYFGGTAAP
jgi:hypothetical protein